MAWRVPEAETRKVTITLGSRSITLENPTVEQVKDTIISMAQDAGISVFDVLYNDEPISPEELEDILNDNTEVKLQIIKVDYAG